MFNSKKKKDLDVLLLARADHSILIYNFLQCQKKISFHFMTFRVLKQFWKFLGIPKVVFVSKHVSILKMLTLRHVLKYNFNKFVDLNEAEYFNKGCSSLLKHFSPHIIHYWPSYCSKSIAFYKKNNPEVITIAEQYMPNPIFVMQAMKPIYERYGLKFQNQYLKAYSQTILAHFDGADYIAVPSKFVEKTMRMNFPTHRYIRIPYGIQISPLYEKVIKSGNVENFVYAGGISLEKGVDQILQYFKEHKKMNLHLYGVINVSQKHLFEPYFQENNIIYHGAVAKDVLQKAFVKMDVGIHPSRFDAYSLAVGEEIGCGLPVIVSDRTGNCDDVTTFNFGEVFEIDNMDSLGKAIEKMTNLNQYNSYKESIDTYIRGKHKPYGQNMCELYEQLLEA